MCVLSYVLLYVLKSSVCLRAFFSLPRGIINRIVKHDPEHYTVTYRAGSDGPEQTLDVGLVMMATGRLPRTRGLGLKV